MRQHIVKQNLIFYFKKRYFDLFNKRRGHVEIMKV